MQKSEESRMMKKINWEGRLAERRSQQRPEEMKLLVTGKHSSRGNTKFQKAWDCEQKEPGVAAVQQAGGGVDGKKELRSRTADWELS